MTCPPIVKQELTFPQSQNRIPRSVLCPSKRERRGFFLHQEKEASRSRRRRESLVFPPLLVEEMSQNMIALLIGAVGAVLTLSAYSQTFITPTQCITVGLFVLMFGLLVREGLISI
ncbi:uncharacterized protein LOC114736794 [Neltuma alba]|uniref:uncharacterized protein LOC114736794 n=1 Tax=Neltuma alba TaxID=207710 RepID=UPI0010A550F9|nr:uncharacterized protein LOC114736794 [Prosopis alba]